MPELLTKHPDVVLQVLKSQGAQCGAGTKPKILTRCPAEKFCTLQGGELCVYGPNEIAAMTQLSRAEVCGAPKASLTDGAVPNVGLAAIAGLVLAGLFWRRSRRVPVTTPPARLGE